ncbi:MAG: HNH/ENDO VII family nuclease [Lachnospiraceae bacterium]|nr:HNH/ENDO VII family nuclease [Lachnospiraceae bacterium]
MSKINRAPLDSITKEQIDRNANLFQRNENDDIVSPNGTGKIITSDVPTHYGHVSGFENRIEIQFSEQAGLTQKEHNEMFTNPGQFQKEPAAENIKHTFENHDLNDAMQNVAAYAYCEDSSIAERTFINPPEHGNTTGTISIVNAQTGIETTLATYENNSLENDLKYEEIISNSIVTNNETFEEEVISDATIHTFPAIDESTQSELNSESIIDNNEVEYDNDLDDGGIE